MMPATPMRIASVSGAVKTDGEWRRDGRDFRYAFCAMATPCEIRIETADPIEARAAAEAAAAEARRIEQKFSRYRSDSVTARVNASNGSAVRVDAETAHLLDFADQCFRLSDGLFDVTSGVFRRVWKFDGSDNVPPTAAVQALLPLVDWRKVIWRRNSTVTLAPGMEIDFGGLAKEYAVDRALMAAQWLTSAPTLVNFGGDLRVSGPRANGAPWRVAIASVDTPNGVAGLIDLSRGALATSGDAQRFLQKDGIRYGHILDPRSGWPVADAPRSVTVAAATCVEAGLSATLAILQGKESEAFLERERVRAWCIR